MKQQASSTQRMDALTDTTDKETKGQSEETDVSLLSVCLLVRLCLR